jgi:hypothetical protein
MPSAGLHLSASYFAGAPRCAVRAATSLSESLIWTGVGADFIDGARNLPDLAGAPLAAWLMPLRGPSSERLLRFLPWLTVAAVATAISPVEIVRRYYPRGFEMLVITTTRRIHLPARQLANLLWRRRGHRFHRRPTVASSFRLLQREQNQDFAFTLGKRLQRFSDHR